MAAFESLVAEVDESDDADKMAMFTDALPNQQKMIMHSGLLIATAFRQITTPILHPTEPQACVQRKCNYCINISKGVIYLCSVIC